MRHFLRTRVLPWVMWSATMGAAAWLWVDLRSGGAVGFATSVEYTVAPREVGRVDQVAVKKGFVSEADVLRAVGDELGLPIVELKEYPIDRELLAQFPTTPIFRHSLLPLERRNGGLSFKKNFSQNIDDVFGGLFGTDGKVYAVGGGDGSH